MPRAYSLSECMHLLAVTNRQLDKLLTSAGIDKQVLTTASTDKRTRLLSEAQFHEIERLHQEGVTQVLSSGSGGNDALGARLSALEAQVRQLLAKRNAPSISHPQREAVTGIVERRFSEDTPGKLAHGQRGIGLKFAGRFAVVHGANSPKSATDWEWQDSDLASETTALAFIHNYLDGHPRAGRWQQCGIDGCPCGMIGTYGT